MRIAHITAGLAPERGGPTSVVKGLAKAQAALGHDVHIYAPTIHSIDVRPLIDSGVQVHLFPQHILASLWPGFAPTLGRALQYSASRFEIIHIHELWHYPHFAAYRAAKRCGIPYVITIHGNLEPWARNHKKWKKTIALGLFQRKILKEASAIYALSEAEAQHLYPYAGNASIAYISNGIDFLEYNTLPSPDKLFDRFPELKGKKIILFLGRFHHIKGLDVLVQAFAEVVRKHAFAHLLLAGPDIGGYRRKIQLLAEEVGIANHITFPGLLTDDMKLAAFAAATLFVLPSRSEGRAVAVIEAMAAGLPVIITPGNHFPEVTSAEAGIKAELTPDNLATAINCLIESPEYARQMGRNGRELVMQHFTWQQIAKETDVLYQDALKRRVVSFA